MVRRPLETLLPCNQACFALEDVAVSSSVNSALQTFHALSPLLRINPLAKDSESARPLAKDRESADGFHEAQDRIAEAAGCDDTSKSSS